MAHDHTDDFRILLFRLCIKTPLWCWDAGSGRYPSDSRYNMPSRDFCKRLLDETGAFLVPGSAFGPEFEGWVRMGFACTSEVLKKGLNCVSKFLRKLEGEIQKR